MQLKAPLQSCVNSIMLNYTIITNMLLFIQVFPIIIIIICCYLIPCYYEGVSHPCYYYIMGAVQKPQFFLSELDDIFALNKEQRKALKAFIVEKMLSLYPRLALATPRCITSSHGAAVT